MSLAAASSSAFVRNLDFNFIATKPITNTERDGLTSGHINIATKNKYVTVNK